MKCPKCQTENPENKKFCRKCGAKLSLTCPKCGSEILPDDYFCGDCGHDLKEPKKTPPIDYSEPQSYTPKFLADKILTSRSAIEGERKLVTVLFADVANYTSISEKLDPEEVHQIMDGCFKILMDVIHKYEGTINQFTGDGVMSLFGAPVAHEDHAQRACYAAISIQMAIKEYGKKVKKETGVDFRMRIGLNSGPVIVGSIGDDLRMDYTAVGDTTNLGSRLESLAKPGAILVSNNTHRLVRDFFEFKSFGKVEIKGKEKPQGAFELIKAGEVESRFRASVAKGLTRFVGRKNSMVALMEPFEKVQSGSGQFVGIVGEAGVGKSRLLLEFINQLPQSEFTYLEGRCLHFGGSIAYLPFLDILRFFFNIKEEDREFIVKEKINEKTLKLDEELKRAIPSFQELMSVKADDEDFLRLDPQMKRDRTFEALRDLFIRESENSALILAIEDLHWVDKTSEDFINYLIDWLPNTRIMLIFLYRPEYTHQWGSKSHYSKIGLDQLGTESSSELVKGILEGGEVAPELRELILNRAAGNPLFMEEFTQTLLENGSIHKKDYKYVLKSHVSDIQVPDTIQGIIAARMDRLEDNLKRTMQVASVIGRDFAFRILQTITGMKEELKSYLLNLQGLEFIYEKRLFPELEYIFKHALTQEVAYNSLLLKRRKEIHEDIGKAIEQIYGERLEELYEMLAHHYTNSENYEKGAGYSKLAAKKARTRSAYIDAISYANKEVFCLEKLPRTDDLLKEIIDARTSLANYCMNLNYHVEAKEAVEPIANLALELNYQKRLPRIYVAIGSYNLLVEENYPKGFKHLNDAIKISEEVKDYYSLWHAYYYLGVSLSWNCEFEKALNHFYKSINLSEAADNIDGISGSKSTMSALNYSFHNKIDLAYQTADESLNLAIKSNDRRIMGIAFSSLGSCCYFKGLFDEAETNLLKAVALIEKTTHFVWGAWASRFLGDINFDRGEYEESGDYYHRSILFSELGKGWPSWINLDKVAKARAKVLNNELDIGLSELINYYKNNRLKIWEGWIQRYIGEIFLNIDEKYINEAEDWIKKAIEADKRNGMMWSLARDYALYAELFIRKDDQSKAKETFGKAIEILKECGADGWVEKYEKELASLL